MTPQWREVKRMTARVLPLLIVSPWLLCLMLAGQTSETNERPVIHASSREVLLDLVVRDKHHHAVGDLRPDEVEVYEDGVRQNVRAFRNVQGAEQLRTERKLAEKEASPPITGPEKAPPLNALREV